MKVLGSWMLALAAAVALLAECHRDEQTDYLGLQPRYLRAPQAERARAAKLAAGKA